MLIFNNNLKPVLLYGCETWVLIERLNSKIQASEMRVLRLIVGVTRRDRWRNTRIREILRVEPVITQIERAQLKWYGHVRRMPQIRSVCHIHDWQPLGRRPVGRPRRQWMDGVNEMVSRSGMDLAEAERLMQNQSAWRGFIKRLPTNRLTYPTGHLGEKVRIYIV